MVHFTEDGNITVIAILYRYGKPDPFLFQVNLCDRNMDWLYHLSSCRISNSESINCSKGETNLSIYLSRSNILFPSCGGLACK
jgi:hypothetical protein